MLRGNTTSARDTTDDADLFLITFYGMLSAMLLNPCNGQTHDDRARALADFLTASQAFHDYPRKHLLAISHWDVRPIMQHPELRPMIDESHMVLAVTDPYFLALYYHGDEVPSSTWPHWFQGLVAQPWETLGFQVGLRFHLPSHQMSHLLLLA